MNCNRRIYVAAITVFCLFSWMLGAGALFMPVDSKRSFNLVNPADAYVICQVQPNLSEFNFKKEAAKINNTYFTLAQGEIDYGLGEYQGFMDYLLDKNKYIIDYEALALRYFRRFGDKKKELPTCDKTLDLKTMNAKGRHAFQSGDFETGFRCAFGMMSRDHDNRKLKITHMTAPEGWYLFSDMMFAEGIHYAETRDFEKAVAAFEYSQVALEEAIEKETWYDIYALKKKGSISEEDKKKILDDFATKGEEFTRRGHFIKATANQLGFSDKIQGSKYLGRWLTDDSEDYFFD